MSDALEHLGDRLGLEEARSFATLIQQSEELGSSITDALRVYSDDMRHKRLSRAEEKAYSLPAKLALPMMICIFPVLFVVILLPVFVRLHSRQLLAGIIVVASKSLHLAPAAPVRPYRNLNHLGLASHAAERGDACEESGWLALGPRACCGSRAARPRSTS